MTMLIESHISVKELADDCEISVHYIYKACYGTTDMPPETLDVICDILECDNTETRQLHILMARQKGYRV